MVPRNIISYQVAAVTVTVGVDRVVIGVHMAHEGIEYVAVPPDGHHAEPRKSKYSRGRG